MPGHPHREDYFMPTIEVTKALKVRFQPGDPLRDLKAGKHKLTAEELKHWYIQGAIDDGRAHELPDDDADPEAEKSQGSENQAALVNKSEMEAAETKLATEVREREKAETKLANEITAHNATRDKLAAASNAAPEGSDVSSSDDLESKMLGLFPGLTPDDFKTDGVPRVKSVEEALGADVNAEQVSAAWAKYQEGK
jgi:hypothetical protein